MTESVSKICRICLEQLGESEDFNFLNNDNSSMLLSKLLNFLPEMDLDFVRNPISCSRCTITIDRIHDFKKLCVKTESIINNLKMQRKSFDDVISYVKKDTDIETIKEEFLEHKIKDEPLIVDDDCLELNTDLPVCMKVPTEMLLYCYNCDYTTYNKNNLTQHVNIHHLQVRQFKCDQCSYTTPNHSSLTAHKQRHLNINCVQKNTHTGEKPYKCNVCDYSSIRQQTLKFHLRSHTGEKPHKCDICDYRCIRKDILKLHLRSHTGEKPYKCNVCTYSSSYKSTLMRHMHTHTGEKPYKCGVCDYSCVQKISCGTI